jgi:mono/diheme cytochrome c family protein
MTGRPPGFNAFRNARGIAAALLLAAFFAAVAGALSPALADTPDVSPEANLGMRMYREGILPSGEKMRGETSGRVLFSGAMAACANCHRRSGMGSAEGGTGVRPVTGAALYRPEEVWGVGPGRKAPRGSQNWPVYTDETLARAIRDGVDPTSRRFDPAMPRYDLADADLALLVAYLKALSATFAPGVTKEVIRFATVVDTRVALDRRNAVLDVLRAYIHGKNAGRRREEERARTAPWTDARRFAASRAWELDIWELSGPEETWEAQLEEYNRRRPVFAMIGGISGGGWGPVQRFCERYGVPCLFPVVDAPVVSGPGYYTVYFSRGVALEADVLARHLSGEPDDIRRGPVVQVYRDDETGRAAAAAFREALSRSGVSGLRDVRLPADGDPPDRILEEAVGGDHPAAVVLWLRVPDLRRFADRTGGASWPGRTYLSSTLAGTAAPAALGAPKGTVYLAHPFALPKGKGERDRARLWLSARKVPPGEERLQNNAFFAAAITVDAVDQLLDFFSRDYLLEKVEHMAENAVPPSSYPRLSLGPGQRFASKGSYILRYAPETGGFIPVGGWIVPDWR